MGSIPVFSVRIKRFLCSTGYRKRLRWMLKNDSDFVRVTRGSAQIVRAVIEKD